MVDVIAEGTVNAVIWTLTDTIVDDDGVNTTLGNVIPSCNVIIQFGNEIFTRISFTYYYI